MTAFLVPIVYSKATIDPVLLPRFLVVSLLGVVLVSAFGVRIIRSRAALTVSPGEATVLGCLLATILVAAISLAITGPTPDGEFELLKLATLVWLIDATSRAIDGDHHALVLLAKLVILSSLLVGGFAVLQYYRVAIFEWMRRDTTVDSTMAHRNLLASFLVLAFPFVTYAFLETEGLWRVASGVTMLISAFLFVALQTRAVWVGLPAALIFSVLALSWVTKRTRPTPDRGSYRPRLIQGAVVSILGLSMGLAFYAPGARAPMREHAGALVQLQGASIQERLQLWSRTIQIIRDHPVTGVGLGNWRVALPAYGTEGLRSDTGTLHFQRPHNDFLWIASEAGLPGGILYLALFVSAMALAVHGIARAPSRHDRLVLTLMLFGVTFYTADSLFSFPKERMSHAVYLALLIGTLLSFHRRIGNRWAARPMPRLWTGIIVLLVWVVTLTAGRFAWSRYRSEVHLRRALEARAMKDWPRMVEEIDRVDSHHYVMDPSSAPVAWYRGVAHFEMDDREAALADFREALVVHPNHVHVLNNIATCYTLRGDHEAALDAYEKAIRIAPRFEEARVNLALLLHNLGRDREAYEVLQPGVADGSSPRFKECLRLVRAALGMEN